MIYGKHVKRWRRMSNIGTYFEIPVTDLNRSIDFYSFVFGHEFLKDVIHNCEMAFFPFEEGAGITGALGKGEIYKPFITSPLIEL